MTLCFDSSDLWQTHTFPKCTHKSTPIHTHANLCLCAFLLQFSPTHTHIHTHTLQVALSPDSHASPDSTNQDKLQPFPSPPKNPPYHILLSFLPPSSLIPSHLALCGRWAAQGPTVIGLDIIYCPLGNVAFQHLIKIISSHSNGRYGLKGTHCNHLDTRGGSCSLSHSASLPFPPSL